MQDGMEQLAILVMFSTFCALLNALQLFALKDVCMVFVNLLKYANATIYGTAPVATTVSGTLSLSFSAFFSLVKSFDMSKQYVIVDVYTELALHHVPALVTLAGLEPLATRVRNLYDKY
jgi:hypothetical protein